MDSYLGYTKGPMYPEMMTQKGQPLALALEGEL